MAGVRELIASLSTVKTGHTLTSPFRQDEQPHGSFIAPPAPSSTNERPAGETLKANDNEFLPSDNLETLAQQIQACLREIGELQVERTDCEALRVEESNTIERRRQREDNAFNEREEELLRNLGTARDVWQQRYEALFKDFDPATMMPVAESQPTGVEKVARRERGKPKKTEAAAKPPAIPDQHRQAPSATPGHDPEPVHIEKI